MGPQSSTGVLAIGIVGLIVLATLPGAAWAAVPAPSVSADRASGLFDGQRIALRGTGFTAGQPAQALECNSTPGQPTVVGFGPTPVAVSCTYGFGPLDQLGQDFAPATANGDVSTTLVVHTGIVGPPTLGLDSAGHNAAADAALYPCPPTAAQQATGASCAVELLDFAGRSATTPISFGAPITAMPQASASPATGLASGQQVSLVASGFTPGSPFALLECNFTPGEPSGSTLPGLPVGCTNPFAFVLPPGGFPGPAGAAPAPVTDPSGGVTATFNVHAGNIGATPDSVAYPCPPTAANTAAGGACALVIEDAAGERAQAAIGISGPPPVPSLAVFPAGGLAGGSTVGVEAWNLTAGSPGGVLECNDAPGQPTIGVSGVSAPVGCTNPFNGHLVTPSPDGTVSASFTIRVGIIGPVADGVDSAGRSAASDAAGYPCPPTAAQQAAGVTCQMVVGDLAADAARQPIAFAAVARAEPATRWSVWPSARGAPTGPRGATAGCMPIEVRRTSGRCRVCRCQRPRRSWPSRPPPTAGGTGWREPTAGSSPLAPPGSWARCPACICGRRRRSWRWPPPVMPAGIGWRAPMGPCSPSVMRHSGDQPRW